MLLQNLHHRYLCIVIRLPHLKDLDQKIPSFPNCDNYRIHRASNPNPLNDDTRTNDNELHQQLHGTFKIDYLQEMDIIAVYIDSYVMMSSDLYGTCSYCFYGTRFWLLF